MLFSEFQKGTGCKDNEHNHKVYKDLEAMYMNSDLSKQDIYEYGKKLVDNSKSEAQVAIEQKVKAEIEYYKEQIELEKCGRDYFKSLGDKWMVTYHKENIRNYRQQIKALRWVIA